MPLDLRGPSPGYVALWACAFGLTLGSELLVAGWALRTQPGPWPRRLGWVAVANVASHPAVWFVFPSLASRSVSLPLSELWAFGLEALLYRMAWPSARWMAVLGASLLANGASYGLGMVLRQLGLL